jgi:hypothetical protein
MWSAVLPVIFTQILFWAVSSWFGHRPPAKIASFDPFYQVRQGRTWSRSYKSPSPPPPTLTRFRILVFLHLIFNFAIFLTTFWQVFGNFLATFWQLLGQFFWQLLTIFWQPFDNFLTTFENLFSFFLIYCTTCTSCYIFFHFFFLVFHLSLTLYSNCCNWSPNYSVLVCTCRA